MKGYFGTGYADKEQNWSVWMRSTRLQSENTSIIYRNEAIDAQVECSGVEPSTVFLKGDVPEWIVKKLSRQWERKTGCKITSRKVWQVPTLKVGLYVEWMHPDAIKQNLMWSSFARYEPIYAIEENGVRFLSNKKEVIPFECIRVTPNYY